MSRIISVTVDDLLDQQTHVIVSEWYWDRPGWWFFAPPGQAREVRKAGGGEVYRELAEEEPLEEAEASLTGSGRLRQYKGIIHVATRSIWGHSSEPIIRLGVTNAMQIVNSLSFRSVSFPILGVTRAITERRAYEIVRDTLISIPTDAEVRIVRSPTRPE